MPNQEGGSGLAAVLIVVSSGFGGLSDRMPFFWRSLKERCPSSILPCPFSHVSAAFAVVPPSLALRQPAKSRTEDVQQIRSWRGCFQIFG